MEANCNATPKSSERVSAIPATRSALHRGQETLGEMFGAKASLASRSLLKSWSILSPSPSLCFPRHLGTRGQARSSARWVYNENPTESIVFCAMRNAARSTVKPPRTALEYISLLSDQHNFFFSPSINTDNYIFTLLLKERKELTSLHKQFT